MAEVGVSPAPCLQVTPLPESRNPPTEISPGVWRLIRTSGVQSMSCQTGTLSLVAAPDLHQPQLGPSWLSIWQGRQLLRAVAVEGGPQRVSVEVTRGPVYLTLDNGSAYKVTSARRVYLSEFAVFGP